MTIPRPGLVFVAAMWVVGFATGLVDARAPELLPISMPYFLVPLGAGLLTEIALRALAPTAAPVTMAERAFGVLGAAVIGFVVAAIAAR